MFTFASRLHLARLSCGLALASALAVAVPALGQQAAGQPPLIDRELFFGDPEISGAQISPDGQYIAFIKPLNGTRNIWVKKADEPFDRAKPVTADTKRPIPAYFWSRDAKYVLFVQDQGGDENYNVYAVDPAAAPAAGSQVPAARNLTDAKSVRAFIYHVSKVDPDTIFVGLNDRDAAWHDVYRVKISTGERTLHAEEHRAHRGLGLRPEGPVAARGRAPPTTGDTEVLRVDPEGFTKVYECGVFETCGPVRFHKDGQRVYMQTNKGEPDLIRLVLFDIATRQGGGRRIGSREARGFRRGRVLRSDRRTRRHLLQGRPRRAIYWRDKAFEADYECLQRQAARDARSASARPPGTSASGSSARAATWSRARPTSSIATDEDAHAAVPHSREAAARAPGADDLPSATTRRTASRFPAYLTLPKGVRAEEPADGLGAARRPVGAATAWGYDGIAQFLANRGYAVLQPNFRGSTGYGKKFLNAGNKQWGDRMQDDLTWGVKHLVSQGIVDAKRVGIMGGSYGGYATLAGVAFTPDVYAAGVAIVGPVEPDHAARVDSALLGGRPHGLPRAHGRPDHARGQGAAAAAVAAEQRREDQDAAAGGAGRQRPAREAAPSRTRSSSRCATAASRSSTSSPPTRGTASRGR